MGFDFGVSFVALGIYLLIKFSMGQFKLHWMDGVGAIVAFPASVIVFFVVLVILLTNHFLKQEENNERV